MCIFVLKSPGVKSARKILEQFDVLQCVLLFYLFFNSRADFVLSRVLLFYVFFTSRADFDVLSRVWLFYVFFTSRAEFDVLSPVLQFYVFFTSRAEFDSCRIGFSWRKSWRRGSKCPLDQFCWTTNLRGIRSKKKCHFRQDINATSCVICFLLANLAASPF